MPRPQLLLCYHKVGPAGEHGRWLNVEPEGLARQVAFFVRRGWRFRTASEAHRREGGTVGFHFDDAYASALAHAPEIFAGGGTRATFFVVPAQIGGSSLWDGDRAAPLAGLDALREAKLAGHEIANHTMTHPRLGDLDEEAQSREIGEARRTLSELGLLRPEEGNSICYPWGSHDPATTPAALAAAGVSAGFSLAKRPPRPNDPLWALPRIAVAYSDSVAKLLYKIHIRPHLP